MIINHNMSAANALRNSGANLTAANKSMEKLSSGLKINRAGDDAAGLSISEKMRAQIRGLDQASSNAQDGISLVQTAEGALNETHNILQRMRELTVQAANDTNKDDERAAVQQELDQLTEEITRISDTTQFNGQNLLGGSFNGTFQIGANEGQTINLQINSMSAKDLGLTGGVTLAPKTFEDEDVAKVAKLSDGDFKVKDSKLIDKDNNVVGSVELASGKLTLTDSTVISLGHALNDGTTISKKDSTMNVSLAEPTGLKAEEKLASGNYKVTGDKLYHGDKLVGTLEAADGAEEGAEKTSLKLANDTKIDLTKLNLAATDLADGKTFKINGVAVTDNVDAGGSTTTLDKAINLVSTERSKLGAIQNRLEHTISNLDNTSENLTSAESRIRDVNMAKEMSTFSKNNILQQAAQAMLAQANQQPQNVLQLLR